MDAILARLSQLEDQTRELTATNVRLVAQDEAHQAALVHLSSDNARLSSEVAELRSASVEQERTMIEISVGALPEGHWIWESTGSGRWVWSRERQIDAARARPTSPSRGLPASLLTLPVELLQLIADVLPSGQERVLGAVCSQLLHTLSSSIDWREVDMTADELLLYLGPRIPQAGQTLARIPRVTSALDPVQISLAGRIKSKPRTLFIRSKLTDLAQRDRPHPRVALEHLRLEDVDGYPNQLEHWLPLLRFLNPVKFTLQSSAVEEDDDDLPTVLRVPQRCVEPLLGSWTHLRSVSCYGRNSVPLLDRHDDDQKRDDPLEGTLALGQVLRRLSTTGTFKITLGRDPGEEKEEEDEGVDEECIEYVLLKAVRKGGRGLGMFFSS